MSNLHEDLDKVIAGLKKNKPTSLAADDALLDSNWNNVVASISFLTAAVEKQNNVPPSLPLVGFAYIRLPGMPVPWEQFAATLQGQWEAVHTQYPGTFLRLAGGDASAFKADTKSVSYDSGVKGNGGAQMDAMQEHQHMHEKHHEQGRSGDRAYNCSSHHTHEPYTKNNTGRTTSETRPKNITIEMYVYKGVV